MTTITETKSTTTENGAHFFATALAGPTKVSIAVFHSTNPNLHSDIWVIVQNASNRAFNGMGKRYRTIEAALAAYKRQTIRDAVALA